jgi:hypothetical protein
MNDLINQVRRLFLDNGQNDKTFTKEEIELKRSKENLDNAMARFKKAADDLYDAFLLDSN